MADPNEPFVAVLQGPRPATPVVELPEGPRSVLFSGLFWPENVETWRLSSLEFQVLLEEEVGRELLTDLSLYFDDGDRRLSAADQLLGAPRTLDATGRVSFAVEQEATGPVMIFLVAATADPVSIAGIPVLHALSCVLLICVLSMRCTRGGRTTSTTPCGWSMTRYRPSATPRCFWRRRRSSTGAR